MTNPSPAAAPFVVVPLPGQDALAVSLSRGVKDPFGREFLAGMCCGFAVDSAVSLVVAGYGSAHCFDEDAAKRWFAALKGAGAFEGFTMEQVLARFSGPFIDLERKKREAEIAQLKEDDRKAAEEKQQADALAAQKKLEEDQALADAAAADALRKAEGLRQKALDDAAEAEAKKKLEEAKAKGQEPVTTAETASNSTSEAEQLREPAPKPTPPAPEPSTRRGNRTPRGG